MARVVSGFLLLAALIGPFLYWDGGLLEAESTDFLVNYTGDRPFAARIFDPSRNDFDAYQARELSYVIDAFDAMIGIAVIRTTGAAVFVPASAVIATVLILWALVRGMRTTMPHIDRWTAIALTACLVTSFPFISTMGTWYRSSKPMLAAVLLWLLFHLRREGGPRANVTALLLGVAGLLDRQGFYLAVVAWCLAAGFTLLTSRRRDLVVGIGATIAVLVLYNLAIAPLLIESLNGYAPNFDYQSRAMQLSWMVEPLKQSVAWLALDAAELLGGNRVLALLAVATLIGVAVRRAQWPRTTVFLISGAAVSLVVMHALMIRQHPPVYENLDHRFWYYPLPLTALITFFLAMTIDAVSPRLAPGARHAVTAALALAVVGNLATLRGDKRLIVDGIYFHDVYQSSERLKASIRSGTPDPEMEARYRRVFDLIQLQSISR
jgi:hypothetical protein